MSFSADVSGFVERAARGLNKTVSEVESQVMALVILRSPVDTGRFRGNWQATHGAPATSEIDRNGAQAAISDMESVVAALKGGRVTFLTNNLPYASRLEFDGWSSQAPEGMVRKTVAQFGQIVDAAARKNQT